MYDSIEESLISEVYNTSNYIIKYPKTISPGLCIICFSSNGIYYPDDDETFREYIIIKNRFEWTKIDFKAEKIIYLRDILKQWYVEGINNQINTPDKLLNFLKKETSGYPHIYTIGSSAGGYAAILYGIWLNAERVFAFCPLIDLFIEENTGKFKLLTKHKEDYHDIYNINNILEKIQYNGIIYYFLSTLSERDLYQYEQYKRTSPKCFRIIKIKSDTHGVQINKDTLDLLVNTCKERLDNLPTYILYRKGFIERCLRFGSLRRHFIVIEDVLRKLVNRILCRGNY